MIRAVIILAVLFAVTPAYAQGFFDGIRSINVTMHKVKPHHKSKHRPMPWPRVVPMAEVFGPFWWLR